MIAIAALISFLATLAVTPLVRPVAVRLGAVDLPEPRKAHATPRPSLGGLALAAGVAAGVLALVLLSSAGLSLPIDSRAASLLGGAALLLLVGAYDDARPISAWAKLCAQVVAGLLAVTGGLRVAAIGQSADGAALGIGWLGFAFSVLWIVAVVNAFNLIDGLDGLCAGVAALAGAALTAVAALNGQLAAAALLAVTSAAALGLLRRNSYPAALFLGDSGSMMLGFLIGAGALWAAEHPTTGVTDLTPALLAIAVPLADLVTAVLRRAMRVLVVQPSTGERERFRLRMDGPPRLFTADRHHVHHRLLDRGYPHRTAVIMLWGFAAITGAAAVGVTAWPGTGPAVLAAAVGLGVYLVLFQLRYQELGVLRRGLLLPLFDQAPITRRVSHPLVDLALAAGSYALAFFVVHGGGVEGTEGLKGTLPAVVAVELGAFYLSGLYRGSYRHAGVGEALRVIRSVALGAAAAAIGLVLVYGPAWAGLAVFVMNGLLLLIFVLGSRVSFRVLDYLHGRGRQDGIPTLLYGAGRAGDLALREILSNPELGWTPVGFIDDHPGYRGRYRGGYPVLGGLEDLVVEAERNGVRQVVVTTRKLTPERWRRLLELAASQGLALSRFALAWPAVPPDGDGVGAASPHGAVQKASSGARLADAPEDAVDAVEPIALEGFSRVPTWPVGSADVDRRQRRAGERRS